MSKCSQCGKECKRQFCTKSCSMKYRHAHKEEYVDYFNRLSEGASTRRKSSEGCLQCGQKTARHYNKLCSKECYRIYRLNNYEEYKKTYEETGRKLAKYEDKECEYCGKLSKNSRFCCSRCYYDYKIEHPGEFAVDIASRKKGYQKFRQKTERYQKFCRMHSNRMKTNNPMYDPDILQKSIKSCAQYWDEHPKEKAARIKRFIQAPLKGRGKKWTPTSLEQKIIDLQIPGLSYVGDGSLFLTIGAVGQKRKKNPDFLLCGKKKVVEVGDIEFWHTMEEIKQTILDYECIGYQCLYLTNRDLDKPDYKEVVCKFCEN